MKKRVVKNDIVREVYVPKPDTEIYVYIQKKKRFMEVPYKYNNYYKYIKDLLILKSKTND